MVLNFWAIKSKTPFVKRFSVFRRSRYAFSIASQLWLNIHPVRRQPPHVPLMRQTYLASSAPLSSLRPDL